MARFVTVYEEHSNRNDGLTKFIRQVLIIPAALILAWVPIAGIYEISCHLGEAGIMKNWLTETAQDVEKRIRVRHVSDHMMINRIYHEYEELREFYSLISTRRSYGSEE